MYANFCRNDGKTSQNYSSEPNNILFIFNWNFHEWDSSHSFVSPVYTQWARLGLQVYHGLFLYYMYFSLLYLLWPVWRALALLTSVPTLFGRRFSRSRLCSSDVGVSCIGNLNRTRRSCFFCKTLLTRCFGGRRYRFKSEKITNRKDK